MNRSQLAGAVGALAAISALVVSSSTAAFTATTDNSGNSWTAGTVVLTDDDAGTALFDEPGLAPGVGGDRCIVVTYDGTVAADVRLYSQVTDGGLGSYLGLTVRRGSGSDRECGDFVSDEELYDGTVAGLATAHSSFGTGAGTWAPSGAGQSVTYQFEWQLEGDNGAQGKSVEAAFTWEAQNS
jgi:hypothetical protein